jgi:hypothetical protein
VARDLRLFYLFRLLATSYLWVPIFVPVQAVARARRSATIMILGGIYSAVVIVCRDPHRRLRRPPRPPHLDDGRRADHGGCRA